MERDKLFFKTLFFITLYNKRRKYVVSCFYYKFIEELVNVMNRHNISGSSGQNYTSIKCNGGNKGSKCSAF